VAEEIAPLLVVDSLLADVVNSRVEAVRVIFVSKVENLPAVKAFLVLDFAEYWKPLGGFTIMPEGFSESRFLLSNVRKATDSGRDI